MCRKAKPKGKWLILFCAVTMISAVLLKLLLDVSVIRIVPTGQNSMESKGINVHISSIVKNNNEIYNLPKMKPDGWYTIWGTNIENYGNCDYPFVIRTHRYDSLEITFFNNPYMGIVEVETPQRTYRLDLYTSNEYGTTKLDIPFSVSEPSSWKTALGLGLIVAAAVTGYFFVLTHVSSWKVKRCLLGLAGCIAAGGALSQNISF